MRRQDGFTLIEILVVILIIGILASLALPAFIGQADKAHDADAKSNAGNLSVQVEACASQSDHTYLDCATAAQIESSGVPIGVLLPPLNQFAAAGGNGNTNNNGVKNGAQCIEQSNGKRACEQTSPGDGSTGSGTDTTTTPTTTTTTETTTTTTETTTTDGSPADTTTGGSAPDVGDCVEGGEVEVGCVGVVTSASGYTITAVSKSTHVFKIVKGSAGLVTRPCTPAGSGGCPSGGSW